MLEYFHAVAGGQLIPLDEMLCTGGLKLEKANPTQTLIRFHLWE